MPPIRRAMEKEGVLRKPMALGDGRRVVSVERCTRHRLRAQTKQFHWG